MKPVALLIEDNEGVALTYRRSLEQLEMEIKWADSLAKGIEMCREIPPPSLIILDLRLGDSKDLNTLNQIATLQMIAPDALVIVVSGFITEELATLAITKGAHAVYEKLSLQRLSDLWEGIEKALQRAPTGTQAALAYTQEIITKLTTTLHLL